MFAFTPVAVKFKHFCQLLTRFNHTKEVNSLRFYRFYNTNTYSIIYVLVA